MKILQFLATAVFLAFFFSCSSEDDICLGGEASPRLKVKFKTASTGKLKTMDSLFIKVDYGQGAVPVFGSVTKTDSVLLPLRVDDAPFTKIYVGTSRAMAGSEVIVHYQTKSEYVSPACGIKRLYDDVDSELVTVSPVLSIEQNQNQIFDENKTHLYLLF